MGRGDGMVLDRTDLPGHDIVRDGCLRVMDAHMVRGGRMRELAIIALILITALIIWAQKGGRR